MSNLFLPPFPEEGLTTDYISSINNIFTVISSHTHVPIIVPQQYPQYPSGNQIESDSVSWADTLSVISIQDCNSLSMIKYDSTPQDNTLFVQDIYSNLYFKKTGFAAIKITNNLFVNFSTTIAGIQGPINFYKANINFDTGTNTYNFIYNAGLLSIYSFNINISSLNSTGSIGTFKLSLSDAPHITNSNGYAFIDHNNKFVYSPHPIRLDRTTQAIGYVFNNQCDFLIPPLGFGSVYPTPASSTTFITLTIFTNTGSSSINNLFTIDSPIWFPVITNDETFGGNIKSCFYSEPFSSLSSPGGTQILSLSTNTERFVWNLTTSSNYTKFTRIIHYNFNLFESIGATNETKLPITGWNDCLIENTTDAGVIEKYILCDVRGSTGINFGYKFHYLYDMGATAV